MNTIPEKRLTSRQLTKILNLVGENPRTNKIMLYDDIFVEKTIVKQMQLNKIANPDDYFQLLREKQPEQYSLIDALNIGYTEFFRNPLTFAILEQLVFPTIVNSPKKDRQKEIRIWSAACATGQEPYSLAMLLEELKENTKARFSYHIFATDANPLLIEKAASGSYMESEIQNVTLKRLNRWFQRQDDNTFRIGKDLKNKIDFSVFDLLNESLSCPPSSIFGDFDLVFCANLLFYYKTDAQQRILSKTFRSVNETGYFACSETERDILRKFGLIELLPPSAVFTSKNFR
jgi:chemotaxis protein methyltransferase CheR